MKNRSLFVTLRILINLRAKVMWKCCSVLLCLKPREAGQWSRLQSALQNIKDAEQLKVEAGEQGARAEVRLSPINSSSQKQ